MSLLDDLSGVELRRRLEQRGLLELEIKVLIDHRDDCFLCRETLIRELNLDD